MPQLKQRGSRWFDYSNRPCFIHRNEEMRFLAMIFSPFAPYSADRLRTWYPASARGADETKMLKDEYLTRSFATECESYPPNLRRS
jgi:hypothetical protein